MKKTSILLLTVLIFLVGCTPAGGSMPAAGNFDPNLSSVQLQLTADSAQAQAEIYSIMATGTAQAPIIHITETAAQMIVVQTQISVDGTSTALQWTPTSSPTPTITSTSTPDLTATLNSAQSIADVRNIQLETERKERINLLKAYVGYAILGLLSILGVISAYVFLKRFSFSRVGVDEFGKPLPVINYIEGVLTDLDKATNGTVGVTQKFLAQLPTITADRQDVVTASSHLIDMNTRRTVPARLMQTQTAGLLPAPDPTEEEVDLDGAHMLLPDWSVINGWNGQSRPLGLGSAGIIVAQAASPHLLTTGGTGSGKTAFMLRAQTTVSLAKGYQVINIGFSNSGFGVFDAHPNYHAVQLTQSSDVIECLASVYRELKDRKQIIGGESIEWEHWRNGEKPPRPFVDVLIDELGNLADDIYTSEETSKEGAVKTRMLWRWMSMIAKEGRKVGIRFIAALQDPTAKSVDLSFRRNCTLVSFQLGDASQSRSFIGAAGAELLQVGHFMTRNFTGNEGIVVGGGFAPDDNEIKAYLNKHAVPSTPAPSWIEGVVINPRTLPKHDTIHLSASTPARVQPTQPISRVDFVNGLSEWEVQALDLYEAGLDQEHIVATVFAGDDPAIGKVAVAELINRWKVVKGVAPANSEPAPVEVDPTAARDADIIHRFFVLKQSKAQIQREVFGDMNTGGVNHQKIRTVIEQHEAATSKGTTTSENSPIFPNLGNVATAS